MFLTSQYSSPPSSVVPYPLRGGQGAGGALPCSPHSTGAGRLQGRAQRFAGRDAREPRGVLAPHLRMTAWSSPSGSWVQSGLRYSPPE